MTYYPDLSPYQYSTPTEGAINVGWLSFGHTFVTGTVDPELAQVLVELAREPANLMRGAHNCEFCDVGSPLEIPAARGGEAFVTLGNGEIRVPGGEVTYVAPTLIVHYIDTHHYLPPEEFLEAVKHYVAGGRY